jgi:LysM repeat protein
LAPLALIAVIVALLAIISGSSSGGSSSTTNDATTAPAAKTTTKTKSTSSKAKTKTTKATGPKTYTVQVGDTLGGIAAKTGVPLSKIQELNPNVDPHSMNAGQEIRLK